MSNFGKLLTKYMRRVGTNPSKVAEQIQVNRLTVNKWANGDSMPKKDYYDKVIKIPGFLRLSDEEKHKLLVAAGVYEDSFPPNGLARMIFTDYIQGLFAKLEQCNPHPVLLLLTQASWSEPPCREAILLKAKQKYFGNVLHLHPPVSLSLDSNNYFADLGRQCDMDCIKNDYDFEQVLKKRVEKSDRLFLLVSRFEQGVPSFGKHLASIIRDISETYPERFHVILCGGEKLAALKYENGSLSLLTSATEACWPELDRKEVYALRDYRFKELQLSDALVDQLLDISGGHPQLLNKCLEFQQKAFNDINDIIDYPKALSLCTEVVQLFTPFKTREPTIQDKLCDLLEKEKLAEYQSYILDDLLRELYWKNLLVWRDNGLYWRCEAIRMAGKNILG